MSPSLPEPGDMDDVVELFLRYLDFYRGEVVRKVAGLPDAEARERRPPFGWSALEMLNHLVHMERRWFVWGFAGEVVDDPWGERDADDHWSVGAGVGLAELQAALAAAGERTRAVVTGTTLDARAQAGGRFPAAGDDALAGDDGGVDGGVDSSGDGGRDGGGPPRLVAILFHVLQEYARHCGHLDIVRELADGFVGEEPAAPAVPGDRVGKEQAS